jgi:PHD/YefM family antitoxin component YafN of YafNO toxin-antitoxin module
METISLLEAIDSLPEILERLNHDNHKLRITDGVNNAIMISEETYDSLLVTLEFLSTPGLFDKLQEQNVS